MISFPFRFNQTRRPIYYKIVIFCIAICSFSTLSSAQSDKNNIAQIRVNSIFSAPIWRADIDSNGNFLAISNAARAYGVWNLNEGTIKGNNGHLLRRIPIEEDQKKRAHAIAIHPTGELIAYSTPPTINRVNIKKNGNASIYIAKRRPGNNKEIIHKIIQNIPTRPQALKFSHDGKYLAAVLSSGCGLRIWSTKDWSLVGSQLEGHGDDAVCCDQEDLTICDKFPDGNSVVFIPSSNSVNETVIATSGDTGVRLYKLKNEMLTLIAYKKPDEIGLERPAGLAMSPDGEKLAVGDRRFRNSKKGDAIKLRIAILDTSSLAATPHSPLKISKSEDVWSGHLIHSRHNGDLAKQGSLDRVAWFSNDDGNWLVGGGVLPCKYIFPRAFLLKNKPSQGELCFSIWNGEDLSIPPKFIRTHSSDRIAELLSVPNRKNLIMISQKRIAHIDHLGFLVSEENKLVFERKNPFIDFRNAFSSNGLDLPFQVSQDAKKVTFLDYSKLEERFYKKSPQITAYRFELNNFKLKELKNSRIHKKTISTISDQLIQSWRNVYGIPPTINGKIAKNTIFGKDEVHRSAAVDEDLKRIVLGSSEKIRLIDYSQEHPKVICEKNIREDAYRISIARKSEIIVSAHSDGTLRWHQVKIENNTCKLETILSVLISKNERGKWKPTGWIPEGKKTGRFSSELDSSTVLLLWQCTLPNGQVVVTPFHRLQKYLDTSSIITSLNLSNQDDALSEDWEKYFINKGCYNKTEIVKESVPPPQIEFIDYKKNTASKKFLDMNIWLANDKNNKWPKSQILNIKTNDDVPVPYSINDTEYDSESGASIDSSNSEEAVNGREVKLKLQLPANIRRKKGQGFLLKFYLNTDNKGERPIGEKFYNWTGDQLSKKPQRRLWAIIVGIAEHEDPDLDLKYSGNDAIDMAKIFVDDYETRKNSDKNSHQDFDKIRINLVLSPGNSANIKEQEKLREKKYIKTYSPDQNGIFASLNDIANEISDEADPENYDEVFLFYFSGHGIIVPSERTETYLATHKTIPSDGIESFNQTAVKVRNLLSKLKSVAAQKIIFFDACRTITKTSNSVPFEPGQIETWFAKNQVDADLFFSSTVGQASVEIDGLHFKNDKRKKDIRGHSLFTFAILKALNGEGFKGLVSAETRQEITARKIGSYIEDEFFDVNNPTSPIQSLQKKIKEKNLPFSPEPRYMRSRIKHPSDILRTIEIIK